MPPINLLDALRVVLLYLFLFLSFIASAQSAQAGPSIRLLSRPQGESIILRWAPVDYQTWSLMRQRGVLLERRVAGTDNWKSVTTDRLIAYQKEDFVELTDTDDPNIVAVAQALHGEVVLPTTLPEGPMGMARLKYDEQEQRFFLAALNADLSRKAAVALGWGWTDHTIQRGLPYEYRVRLLPKEQQVGPVITSETVLVRSTDNFPFGPVVGLAATAGDEKITLSWPEFPNRRRYLGYYLEVSEDGTNFTATTEVPIIKTQAQQEGDLGFTLEVNDLENYLPRHYRLVGVNAFGERSEPGEAIVAMSVDLTPPAPLAALRAEDNHASGFRLTWDFPKATDLDTRGYVIVRSTDYEGPYHPVNETALDPLTTEFTDPAPIPHMT
ncbi:MAG: fibronectin type III domain-containing protein, partial [Bacteroidota bacterium]